MRVFAAKVKGGTIVPEQSEDLPEGTHVTVIADDGEASFTATAEEEQSLLDAGLDDTGIVTAQELLARLR